MNLPPVLSVAQSQPHHVVLTLEIAPKHEAFHGHFPANPILPGVVQLDWAARFATLHFNLAAPDATNFQVKFKNIIRPTLPLALTLQFDDKKNHLSFAYHSNEEPMSYGHFKSWIAS